MSLFSNMKPDGGQKLHPFDLSRRDIFSVKSGVLNVNFIQHTIPESKYEVNHAQITRVDAVQTAPFARMSENYEYYFVPYSQIFKDFERIYYERGDTQRNFQNSDILDDAQYSTVVPTFDLQAVVYNLSRFFVNSRAWNMLNAQYPYGAASLKASQYSDYNISDLVNSLFNFDLHGDFCIDESLKLFDMLGYGNLFSSLNSLAMPVLSFVPASVDGLTVDNSALDVQSHYDKIANTYNYELLLSLLKHFECQYPLDDLLTDGEVVMDNFDAGDLFGYYHVICGVFYSYLKISYHTPVDPTDYSYEPYWVGHQAAFFSEIENIFFSSQSTYDYLYHFVNQFNTPHKRYPSIFALAAYNKVFSDIYRNTQFDTYNYSTLYNFDFVVGNTGSRIPTNTVLAMLTPRFRQYKKDMFTGVFPNAQFGSVAVSQLSSPAELTVLNSRSSSPFALYSSSDILNGKVYQTSNSASPSASNSQVSKFSIDSSVSALAIRQALSLQRYKERILRAGNRLSSLQNAVFGDRSRFIENNYVQFIGAEHNNIDFNSVAATSDAGVSEVGQLGGNGVGTHVGKAFEFHSHDFGMIIGIYYILPESEYENFMIDAMNTKSETNDFYKPDFMNLGLSPVFNYNFNIYGALSVNAVTDTVLGYLANYWEYKTAIDRVHGNFYCSVPQSHDVPDLWWLPSIRGSQAYLRGQNSMFVTPRVSSSYRDGLTLSNLYVNPHDIDTIFYVNSDFTMDTDQFKCNCNHDVKALLPMSVVGLPEY